MDHANDTLSNPPYLNLACPQAKTKTQGHSTNLDIQKSILFRNSK